MAASSILLLISFTGCVWGTSLKENLTSETVGILLSGGDVNAKSVEVFSPSTGKSCSLPSLPDERNAHTMDIMDNIFICGGLYNYTTLTTCLSFSSGEWTPSKNLYKPGRAYHTSWHTGKGLVLLAGDESPDTTELITVHAGHGTPSFDMMHSTRRACSMTDLISDSLVITGGYLNITRVARYDQLGYVEDLPSLLVGRWHHGCGSYLRETDGTQVFLVAGGYYNYDYMSSTEVLIGNSPTWALTTPLPRILVAMRAVTVQGVLYLTGGCDESYKYRDEVIAWMDKEQEWVETGRMKVGRRLHALTTIQMDDPAMEYCG